MADLKLSQQLIDNIQKVIVDADTEAQDAAVSLQYLAAVTGFILGSQNMQKNEKDEFLDQLYAFSKHVLDDVCKQATPPAAAANAFGTWKPS